MANNKFFGLRYFSEYFFPDKNYPIGIPLKCHPTSSTNITAIGFVPFELSISRKFFGFVAHLIKYLMCDLNMEIRLVGQDIDTVSYQNIKLQLDSTFLLRILVLVLSSFH